MGMSVSPIRIANVGASVSQRQTLSESHGRAAAGGRPRDDSCGTTYSVFGYRMSLEIRGASRCR